MSRSISYAICALSTLAVVGCGATTPTTPAGVGLRVTSLQPAQITQSDSPQVLSVTGSGFVAGLVVSLTDPTGVTRTFDSAAIQSLQPTSFRITATLDLSGSYSLQTGIPSGDTSTPFTFVVQASGQASTPHIDAVTPASTTHSSAAQIVQLTGTGFSAGLTVTVTDPSGAAMTFAGTELGATTSTTCQLAPVLSVVGTYSVYVTNADGQTSNVVTLIVL